MIHVRPGDMLYFQYPSKYGAKKKIVAIIQVLELDTKGEICFIKVIKEIEGNLTLTAMWRPQIEQYCRRLTSTERVLYS